VWAIRHTEEPERFEALLYDPPVGVEPSEEVIEREQADFAAFAAAFGGR
jgi:hypothetical protein